MCYVQEQKTSLNFMGTDQRETLYNINTDTTYYANGFKQYKFIEQP